VILGGVVWLLGRSSETEQGPSINDTFAQCLTEKGVKFYGAWWCPHCQNQKKLFGSSFRLINSIECAPPGNTRDQLQVCKDAGIQGYPTWVFADGSRQSGEMTFEALAEKTSCSLPVPEPI